MRERAARIALREQALERHEPIGRVHRTERLGLHRVDHFGADARVLAGELGEGALRLVLRSAKTRRALMRVRVFERPMARHPKQLVLPVLNLPQTARVVDIDAQLSGHARPAELAPAHGRLAHLDEEAIALEPALLKQAELEPSFHATLNALLPKAIATHAFDEAKERLLDVLAHLRMQVRHDGRHPSRAHAPASDAFCKALFLAMNEAALLRDRCLSGADRKAGGVVHTPPYVAQAIVQEASQMLAAHRLPLPGEAQLRVLDPATGPGVFLAAVLAHTHGSGGALLGVDRDTDAMTQTFELLRQVADARGWTLTSRTTDPLDAVAPFVDAKRAQLVIGNPPWVAGRGDGISSELQGLLADYLVDGNGAPIRERRSGVLADAYVRFIRWGTEVITRSKQGGVLALVTNHSYLDGPVHRGMRASLLKAFDEVRVLDLGGSALTARNAGDRDANLFGVRPGAAVLLCAKGPHGVKTPMHYARLSGDHASKRAAWMKGPSWTHVKDAARSFVPAPDISSAYATWPSLAEWFPFHAEGVQTNRDAWITQHSREALLAKLDAMARDEGLPPARAHFDLVRAQATLKTLLATGDIARFIVPLAYRPFETRWLFAHPHWCHRLRPALALAMQHSSVALISARKDRGARPWMHLGFATSIVDNCFLSTRSSCRARAFPSHAPNGSENVSPDIHRELIARGIQATSIEVLAYVGAWLSSRSVRAELGVHFLSDYPRIPLPRDAVAFQALAQVGLQVQQAFAAHDLVVGEASDVVGHHGVGPRGLDSLADAVDEALRAHACFFPERETSKFVPARETSS